MRSAPIVPSCVVRNGKGHTSSSDENAGIGRPPTPGIGGPRARLLAAVRPPRQRGSNATAETGAMVCKVGRGGARCSEDR